MNTMNDEFIEIGESYAKSPTPSKPEPEESPLVMYLVVRESLGMSIGKTAAQVAHAAQKLQQRYQELEWKAESYLPPPHDCSEESFLDIPEELRDKIDIFSKWCNGSVRKVVLKADEKEWAKLKSDLDWARTEYYLVVDAGFTELAPHTETVIGLWPIRKNDAPKVIKRLQVLK